MERVHPEGRRLSYEIADQINSFHFDGVYLLKESKREYTHNEMLSHVLGYVGIDNQGLSGLELQYDDILTGEYGGVQYFSDAQGHNLDRNSVYVEQADGLDIYLTVNYELQSSIERELDNIVTKYNPEGAWTLAMDPNTGEIPVSSTHLDVYKRQSFDYGVFTNLTKDHIGEGEHENMEDYIYSKSLLFQKCKHGILNIDDIHYEDMIKNSCLLYTSRHLFINLIVRMMALFCVAQDWEKMNIVNFIHQK